jgi:hypothetical protein
MPTVSYRNHPSCEDYCLLFTVNAVGTKNLTSLIYSHHFHLEDGDGMSLQKVGNIFHNYTTLNAGGGEGEIN